MVWRPGPREISGRLGWLHSPEVMMDAVEDIKKFVDEVRSEGFSQALLLDIGGSILVPEVIRHIFGVRWGEG